MHQIHLNFFIIGAPKSGTTALSEYLRRHPSVLFSRPKEPHYFNDDFSHRHIQSLDEYLKCFSHGTGQEIAIGEGSVFYLYSRTAVGNILRHYPDARFIVMLRNPVQAVYSWHWQAIYSFGETLEDFEEALRAQEERRQGMRLPRYNRVREALQYGPLFSYSGQLQRLFDQVSREHVHIILYDDFKDDPASVYQDTLQFLSLPPFSLEKYERFNPSKRFRWRHLERFVRFGSDLKQAMGIRKGLGLLTRLQRWNTRYQQRPPLRPDFRTELAQYFRDDLRRTAELIKRDLSRWLDG